MNRGILFFLGLLFGILICVLLFYLDISLYEKKCPPCDKKEVIKLVVTDTVYVETVIQPVRQYQVTQTVEPNTEEVITIDEQEPAEANPSIYESDFSFEEVQEDEVFSDQLLRTRTARVTLLHPDKQDFISSEDYFQFFEIQQWSTPIKNRITYHRDQNMIKIKGMEIDKVNIVFWKENYYLEIDNRFYNIPEKNGFEELMQIVKPQ